MSTQAITPAIRAAEYAEVDRRANPRDGDVWSDEYRARFLCGLADIPLHIEGLLPGELCRDCDELAIALIHDDNQTEYIPICGGCKAEREVKPEYADPIDERAFVREETRAINSNL